MQLVSAVGHVGHAQDDVLFQARIEGLGLNGGDAERAPRSPIGVGRMHGHVRHLEQFGPIGGEDVLLDLRQGRDDRIGNAAHKITRLVPAL